MRPSLNGLIPNLDLLRAVAVLCVLVDHTLWHIGVHSIGSTDMRWLGRMGVLFFFVHTCCVLMSSLERHKGGGLISRFFVRRAFRIYPLSIAAVLLATIPPHVAKMDIIGWLSNLALSQNLVLRGNAFGSLWSLPIEVQMYLALPFIFLLVRRSKGLWFVVGLLAFSIPVALWQPHHVARASVLAFVPAFLPGVIAYWLFKNCAPRLPSWNMPALVAGVSVAFLLHPSWTFSAWMACLALGVGIPLFRQIESKTVNAVTFQLAKYSYGIYLVHSLLMQWIVLTWRDLPFYLAMVALGSIAAYHLIEHPMIRLGRWLTDGKPLPVAVTAPIRP